jgi:nucleoside-diphosphate-sugar epimerase
MANRMAFVTGATGFVGVNLVKALKDADWHVVALHRPTSNLKHLKSLGAGLIEGSITEKESLRGAMPDGPEAVFHVAANLSFAKKGDAKQTRDNVEGTRNVVEVAIEKRARRFIHTSSVAAYGHHRETISEATRSTALESPVNYVRTKWLAEEEVRAGIKRGLDAVILNPVNILGPYDTTGWARMIRLVATRKLPGVGPGGGAFCHVREVVKAHVAAVERGRTGENYLLGGVHASYLEVVKIVAELTGGKAPRRAMPPWLVTLLGRALPLLSKMTGAPADITPEVALMLNLDFSVDSAKAERELGYRLAPLREMVEDSYRWLKAEGAFG